MDVRGRQRRATLHAHALSAKEDEVQRGRVRFGMVAGDEAIVAPPDVNVGPGNRIAERRAREQLVDWDRRVAPGRTEVGPAPLFDRGDQEGRDSVGGDARGLIRTGGDDQLRLALVGCGKRRRLHAGVDIRARLPDPVPVHSLSALLACACRFLPLEDGRRWLKLPPLLHGSPRLAPQSCPGRRLRSRPGTENSPGHIERIYGQRIRSAFGDGPHQEVHVIEAGSVVGSADPFSARVA